MQYEIREMTVGEILDTGFRLLRNHFALLAGLALIVALPAQVAGVFAESVVGTGSDLMVALGGMLAFLIFVLLVSPIVQTAITHSISELYQGREVEFGEVMSTAFRLFLPIIGTGLLSSLAIMMGFVLLVIPGIYLAFAFLIVYQVAVIERVFAVSAMKRSRDLISGHMLRALGLLLAVAGVSIVVSLAVNFTIGLIPMAGVVANGIVSAVTTAFQSVVLAVFYFDLRCRKEAFDLEHLARAVEDARA